VNKSELIIEISEAANISKASAGRALNATLATITRALQQSDPVMLMGFGTFSVRVRAARTGRNPRTGESLEISVARVPTFKPAKALKEAVN